MSSPYEILGIEASASDQDIKRAYRSLQLQFHPDRNPSPEAADKIRQINEAYATLSDKEKRRHLDMRFRHMESPVDLFHMLFGQEFIHIDPRMFMQQQQQQQQQQPPAINRHITLTLEQAYSGCTLPVEIERWVMGEVKVTEIETVYLDIPPGIDDSEMIHLPDKGHVLHEHNKGAVKIKVGIDNQTAFRRHGLDLVYVKTLTLKEALCGFSFEIKHVNGKTLSMNNSQTLIRPHFRKVVPGLGMKRDKNVGALVLEFTIEFPESLTPEQVAVLRETL